MLPLFPRAELPPSPREQRSRAAMAEAAGSAPEVSDLSRYYYVDAKPDALQHLAKRLRGVEMIEGVYVKPAAEPPVFPARPTPNSMAPAALSSAATADYTARQVYLGPAPAGVDALHAWTVPGGGGAGVRVMDCEWGMELYP
jgi:hypothetical protein